VLSRKNNIDTLAKKTSADLVPLLTEELHSIANASGWPKDIVVALGVEVDEFYNLEVTYPPELKSQIEDLEYGAEFGLPNAAIRPFLLRSSSTIERVVERDAVLTMIAGVFNG